MGFLSEIKRLLFVKESIAKSAVKKSVDYAKEKGEDIVDKSRDIIEDTGSVIKNKTSGLRDAILENSESTMDYVKEKSEDVMDAVVHTSENLLDNVKEKASEAYDSISESEFVKKTAVATEKVGDKILDAGEATMGKAKDLASTVGKKVMDLGDDLMEKTEDIREDISEKAKNIGKQISEKFDETVAKAEKMEAEEALKPKSEFADTPLDISEPLLKDDDFFSKANKYADGDYGAFSEGKITVGKNPEYKPKASEGKAAGFEDIDGDGDEIIDDAEIVK